MPASLRTALLHLLHEHGSLGNQKARELLGCDEATYTQVKEELLAEGLVVQGRGRGGSIKLANGEQHTAVSVASSKPLGRPPKQPTTGYEPERTKHTVTSKQRLEATLWNIADKLRGKMSADDFRDYILGFIFYKYLSEKMELYADEILHPDGLSFSGLLDDRVVKVERIDTGLKEVRVLKKDEISAYRKAVKELSVEHLGYFVEPEDLFKNIVPPGEEAEGADAPFILQKLTEVLLHISDSTRGAESEDDFANLFEDLDLTSSKLGKSEKDKNNLVVKVLRKLATVDFELNDPTHDVLGDAYEYLIAQFASGAGKKAGEFYTPQEVSTVLARIVTTGKKRLKAVYDPTCGSGSLLLRVKREVLDVGTIYGQEMNPTTFNLCRMNMIMHDVHYRQFDVRNEDTLERPQHLEHRFEAIVANPPFSAQWNASVTKSTDDRFSAPGKLAPKTKADFAFLLHMLHHLEDGGTLACVLPHGVLFRGAAEAHIREYLIRDLNVLDAVIGLPAQIFYGTGIPTCIVVLKKQRKTDDVLFIDASQHYEKVKTQNKLRPADVDRIVSTYRERSAQEKYSHLATLAELKANGYNLNIPRYVDTFEAEEAVDLMAVVEALKEINAAQVENDELIRKFCTELSLPFPEGWNASLLEEYKKGVVQQLFAQELRFKRKDGGEFPEWEEKRLGDVYTYHNTNSLSRDKLNYEGGDVLNIHYGDIHTKFAAIFKLENERVPFINDDVDLSRVTEEQYCQPCDLVIADASEDLNDIGKTIEIMSTGGKRVVAGLHTYLARPKKGTMAPGYGAYLMRSTQVREEIERLAHGTKVMSISRTHLNSINVSLPSLEEQTRIAGFLSLGCEGGGRGPGGGGGAAVEEGVVAGDVRLGVHHGGIPPSSGQARGTAKGVATGDVRVGGISGR